MTSTELDAVKRGYAFVEMNERGHFFSEGNYDILGAPLSDGDDALTWMLKQPWSNGKWEPLDAHRQPNGSLPWHREAILPLQP